jgi:hypothetical protein
MKNILTLLAGLTFGFGLIISGMSNPNKVINFLDITGNWDPSLALVMIGAIPMAFLGFRWIESKHKTIFNEELHLPGKNHFNPNLLIGSALFGVGWAITGFCPGPALVALGAGSLKAMFFVGAMLIGMMIHDRILKAVLTSTQR